MKITRYAVGPNYEIEEGIHETPRNLARSEDEDWPDFKAVYPHKTRIAAIRDGIQKALFVSNAMREQAKKYESHAEGLKEKARLLGIELAKEEK